MLSSDAHADVLQEHYPLDEAEARALAYVRAGWAAQDLHAVISDSRFDKGELVQDAREAVDKADQQLLLERFVYSNTLGVLRSRDK